MRAFRFRPRHVPFALALCLAACTASPDDAAVAPAGTETALSQLKSATAALVAAAPEAANAAVDAPPVIWRVPGAIQNFRDCPDCPEMVVVPAGSFSMGAPAGERFRAAETQHRVTIRQPF